MYNKLRKFSYLVLGGVLLLTLCITQPSSAMVFTNTTRLAGVGGEVYGMSNDGRYYVLQSTNYTLAPNGVPGQNNVYLYDNLQHIYLRVSSPLGGAQPNGASSKPSISADGRYIAFQSVASNLVTGDTNNVADVFLYDRQSGQLTLESRSSAGALGNKISQDCQMSADGQYIVFTSKATNFDSRVPSYNDNHEVYIRSLVGRGTMLVSVSATSSVGNGYSNSPRFSNDNEYVVYTSNSFNLVSASFAANNLPTGAYNVFRYSTRRGTTELVTRPLGGGPTSPAGGTGGAISGDGNYVTFISASNELVSGVSANGNLQVYGRDMTTGVTELITKSWQGYDMGNSGGGYSVVDSTGRYIAYTSAATNLIENDIYHSIDAIAYRVFMYDRVTGMTKMASMPFDGLTPTNPFMTYSDSPPVMRRSGGQVAFATYLRLVPDDDSNSYEVHTLEFGE